MIDNQQPISVPQSEQQAALDAALASLSPYQPLQTTVQGNNIPGIPNDLTLQQPYEGQDTDQTIEQTQVDGEQSEQEADTAETEQQTQVSPEFTEQFKQAFGLEPQEAIETFNSLIAFRDEVRLMAEWDVNPSEYRQRMTQVKEVYDQLPEQGKAEFNTVEGAIAIWNHIQKQQPQTKKTPTVKPSAKTTKQTPKQDIIRKSEVLRMSDAEYKANAGRINKAVLEGRFIEDV